MEFIACGGVGSWCDRASSRAPSPRQENPDLPGNEAAYIYKCWDATFEEHVTEDKSESIVEASGELDSTAMDAFMRAGALVGPKVKHHQLAGVCPPVPSTPPRSHQAELPKAVGTDGQQAKQKGKPPKAQAKVEPTPEQKARKDTQRLCNQLGEALVEGGSLSVRPRSHGCIVCIVHIIGLLHGCLMICVRMCACM